MTDRELMQQALEALEWCRGEDLAWVNEPEFFTEAIAALRERLAQPEQEPVAWTPQVWRQFKPDGTLEFQKIKRTPNGAWEDYTTPPRREWVGLTDEEIAVICGECAASAHRADDISYARAIEVKLKERNT